MWQRLAHAVTDASAPRRGPDGACFRSRDAESVAEAGAHEFVRAAEEAIALRGRFAVALAGGSTPRAMLGLLAEEPLQSEVAWERVDVFFGDERTVPPDHEESNYRMVVEALLSKVAIAPDRIHRMRGEDADPAAAAADYASELVGTIGRDEAQLHPRLDLVFLGMGEDGHTASLFPGTRALEETRAAVVANVVPQLGTTRITMTYPLLEWARRIVFMVAGASKAAALTEIFETEDPARMLPAGRVRSLEGSVLWLVDEAAAAGLGSLSPRASDDSRSRD